MANEPYRGYLINPSGVLIKPIKGKGKGKNAHAETLLGETAQFKIDPMSGEQKQVAGFRIPSEKEIKEHLDRERKRSREMERQELQRKKNAANIVMMAPDDAQLERMMEARAANLPIESEKDSGKKTGKGD